MVEDVRVRLLKFFSADPEDFDLVFVANATAGIKLVGEAFCELEGGFEYGYHVESHTSLVGLRELAKECRCLETEHDVNEFLAGFQSRSRLFAYPAQSNMNGRRLPLDWAGKAQQDSSRAYTLLDAAAYASTSPLDLHDAATAPDFTVLSLYKIFGFPDLGALIVKKSAAHVFNHRRYFGGGTVDMVACLKEQWHAKKSGPLHERLEDGTLPVHNIVALKAAMQTHQELFDSLERISKHTASLAKRLYEGLTALKHGNGRPVCTMYKHDGSTYDDLEAQGPIIAFNLCDSQRNWVSNTEVEKLAAIKNIHLRTGGVCNPGGIAKYLALAPWELRENFSAGHRCGSQNDILNGKPTGIIRLSLGAMSTREDVNAFIAFIEEFFVERTSRSPCPRSATIRTIENRFHVESLTIYPIKSCGGWHIPHDKPWEVRAEGLAWDREWCVINPGTGKALSQKQHPRMALLRPTLDFAAGVLRVGIVGTQSNIGVPLSKDRRLYATTTKSGRATVCEDAVEAQVYALPAITDFLTNAIGVSCMLARYNPGPNVRRHSKANLQPTNIPSLNAPPPMNLSNESPILTISRSSLNRLNEQIKATGGKAAHPSLFRANIVLAENPSFSPGQEQPWIEDTWSSMQIGGVEGPTFEFLGGCRRCQMVCVDQYSAEKNAEPFVTLAKTRRFQGRVLFGVHTALLKAERKGWSVRVGALVETSSGN